MGGKPTEPVWLYGLAGALMLGGPVWHELYVNHYPARPEAFLLPLLAGAIGTIVAVVSRVVGGLLGTIAFGGLLFVFSDLQLDPQHWTYTALVLAGCVGLAQLLISHRAAISALSLGAFYLSSLLRPPVAPPPTRLDTTGMARSTNPVLVHIVLDEQWGVGGLRAAGDSETADFLNDFYRTRGFELFESAYSHYEATASSLESVMLLGETGTDSVPLRKPYQHVVRRNPYFGRLHELGYEIRVYQTTFIDFCNGETAVVSCDVRLESSMGNIGFLDGGWVARGMWVARYFLATRSHIYAKLFSGQTISRRSAVGGGVAAGRNLTSAIGSHPKSGTAWFAHLLLPHRPVHADDECRVQSNPLMELPYNRLPEEPPTDLPWPVMLSAYAGQVRCAHRVLAEVIDAIDSTVGRDHSIVIVQGDHGSRLHQHDAQHPDLPLAAYPSSELNTHFATLLAVRRPQVPATLHREPAPVQDVIWELARSGFSGALPETWPHYVRTMPDRVHPNGYVRSLTAPEMPWARQPD